MPPAPATSEMLAEMSACAYRLGMAFAGEAERAEEPGQRLEMFQLFDRCFFAVRVATALQLRLRREGGSAQRDLSAREPAGDSEELRDREPLETERAETQEPGRERLAQERDRDREIERASLPILLKTLQGVAADAAALPGPKPAALPTLQELLARATGEPAPAKPRVSPLCERLAGSAAVAAAPLAPGLPTSPGPRRATGPPR